MFTGERTPQYVMHICVCGWGTPWQAGSGRCVFPGILQVCALDRLISAPGLATFPHTNSCIVEVLPRRSVLIIVVLATTLVV